MGLQSLLARLSGRGLPPDQWGRKLSNSRLTSLTRDYLAGDGWKILPPWDWLGIHIRATRGKSYINMVPVTERMMRWNTLVKDVRELADKMESTVGIITTEDVHVLERQEALGGGSFIVTPSDLPTVADVAQQAIEIRKRLQKVADATP